MKKIASIVTVIAAFALVVCLAGCSSDDSSSSTSSTSSSSGINLDETVTFEGLTYSVSSEWEMTPTYGDSDTYGYDWGDYLYKDVNGEIVLDVYYSNQYPGEVPAELSEKWINSLNDSEHSDYKNINTSDIKSASISGLPYTTYEYSWDVKSEFSDSYTHSEGFKTYISGWPELFYSVQTPGNDSLSLTQDVLKSASID